MLKEALQFVLDTCQAADKVQMMHPPAEPEHVYLIKHPDSKSVEKCEALPPPRGHKALDLDTVADMAKRFHEAKLAVVIWYSRDAVVCLFDDETRRDRVTLPLVGSKPMQLLRAWEERRTPLSQAELVFLLRTTLYFCLGAAAGLIDVVRSIKWARNEQGQATITQGKRSIGNQLTAEITGTSSIPEYVTLQVPVFEGNHVPKMISVQCALDADPATEKFLVSPLAGELERATREAEAWIADYLMTSSAVQGTEVPVYYGHP